MAKITISAFADEASPDLSGQIAAMLRCNIPYLEMRNVNGINVSDLSTEAAKEYKKTLEAEGLSVWAAGSPIGKIDIFSSFSETTDRLKHTCEIVHTLGTDKIRIFSFFGALSERNEVIERLCEMVEIAASYGVGLYHENEKNIYGDTAERVLDLMKNVPGLKFVYDPANYIQTGESADKTLSLFHTRTDYFHIKDVIAKTQELVPAGYGDGQIKKLVEMISDDKVLTLEPHLAVFDGYSKIDDTEMKHRFNFKSNDEAFDAASKALKKILLDAGYTEKDGGYIK